MVIRWCASWLVLLTLIGPWSGSVAAQSDDTVDQAVWLLRKSTLVHGNGFHNVLLRSLRQLRDPRLEPLFSELTQRRYSGLKIHGILGLAEIAHPPHLDLALVADIDGAGLQAQLIGEAMQADLLRVEEAKQLVTWPGLDRPVRILVAAFLVSRHEPVDTALLDEAMASDNLAQRSMAALLKLQLGDEEAASVLHQLNAADVPNRDAMRVMVLQTAMRNGFDRIGPWALTVAKEPDVDPMLAYQALRAGLQFSAPNAVNTWMHRYDTARGEADRMRLAMLAIDLADQLDPRVFRALANDEQELIRHLGRVGEAIAQGRPYLEEALGLLGYNNLLASRWVLQHAAEVAAAHPKRARALMLAIIEAGNDETPRLRAQRLEHVVLATEKLHELDPNAGPSLREQLREASMFGQEAMLMGLIRSHGPHPERVVAGVTDWRSKTAESMALLLRAKHAEQLAEEQMKDLSLIVRGGAGLQEPLRIQAAWTYLRLTEQDRVALASVLGGA
jgi:hypothetical protein